MQDSQTHFNQLVSKFSALEQVDAIMLAGSRGSGQADSYSDYDLYVYLNSALSVEQRKLITDQHCEYMELNNQFWETEDDGVLIGGVEIEIIYRGLDWLEQDLSSVVEQAQARVGYTTCFWANLLDSQILFDRTGNAQALQQRFNCAYSAELQQAIIEKNLPLLKERIPAYYHQLAKALKRDDRISLNHRCAELIASYFDIIFAVNKVPHPGEKRMLAIAQSRCDHLPMAMSTDLLALIEQAGNGETQLLDTLDRLIQRLQQMLTQLGLSGAALA